MFYDDDFSIEQCDGIVISASNELLCEKAAGDEFCWGYYLRIENNSPDKISLLGSRISVTDNKGRSVSVASDGFKGELPILEPGDVFEFEDYATSKTSSVLYGSCKIADSSHRIREIRLPVLSLIANDNKCQVYN